MGRAGPYERIVLHKLIIIVGVRDLVVNNTKISQQSKYDSLIQIISMQVFLIINTGLCLSAEYLLTADEPV